MICHICCSNQNVGVIPDKPGYETLWWIACVPKIIVFLGSIHDQLWTNMLNLP